MLLQLFVVFTYINVPLFHDNLHFLWESWSWPLFISCSCLSPAWSHSSSGYSVCHNWSLSCPSSSSLPIPLLHPLTHLNCISTITATIKTLSQHSLLAKLLQYLDQTSSFVPACFVGHSPVHLVRRAMLQHLTVLLLKESIERTELYLSSSHFMFISEMYQSDWNYLLLSTHLFRQKACLFVDHFASFLQVCGLLICLCPPCYLSSVLPFLTCYFNDKWTIANFICLVAHVVLW